MTRVPVARRRYDITPAEMLDLARSAVDAVVSELKTRTDELLPDQLNRLEQVSASLARTVSEVAEAKMESVRVGLNAVRDDISTGMAEHDARLIQAVETRLAGYDPAEFGRSLPAAVASAVFDVLEPALPPIDKGIHELRELVGELVERGKRTELSRQSSLDHLDEVLVELRAGLAENVTRQHGVLLEVFDQKLTELKLTELAAELPTRIGTVISNAVQRSHDIQAQSMQDLATALGKSLDAGIGRQRSATAELSATAERMADSVAGFSEVAEEAVTIAFERAQAAQAQRLSTMMGGLRESQQESVAELRSALELAVQELRAGQADQAEALSREMGRQLDAILESALAPQQEALAVAGRQMAEVVTGQAEGVMARMDAVAERMTAHVGELMDALPQRLGADIAAVLEETRARHERVESLIAELAWALGEQRGGSTGLREDLAKALEALPAAISSLQEASLRSEARITDLLARKLTGPDAR